ncbi:MAG: hypothetical protein EOP02_20925 [Proteobacteria bacterium]|nr:MAG: hypothetical protein EOP02_20925 [Pseudomonadota bacterium]
MTLIDTGAAVARQLQRLLVQRDALSPGPAAATRFWTSGDAQHFNDVLPVLWQKSYIVQSFML